MSTTEVVPEVDVVIVGAGLSGIGAACRLQQECPDRSYAILEARDAIGGTWDLFRYPGIRSDSDMFTLSYPFRPWRDPKAIADGPAILRYVEETAAEYDVERHIRFRTKVLAADWSTEDSLWTLTLAKTAAGGTTTQTTTTCRFLYSCAGYYDYDQGHEPVFPGLEDFTGEVVRPQFWPEDLDHRDQRVVIIGSGATAVTLVPSMADDAAHVTMLQRSPTWITSLPARDPVADKIRAARPAGLAHRVIRGKNIVTQQVFYQFCRTQPRLARRVLSAAVAKSLGDPGLVDPHFTPTYDPWDQRFCIVPDGDLFRAIRKGSVDVVTDQIDTFVPEGIRLRSGRVLEADIVVTATGLKLLAFGGIEPSVDGVPVDLREQFVWQGAMVTGLPNFAVCIGYTNASWTLRADLTSRLVCKVLNEMRRRRAVSVVPEPDQALEPRPMIDLASGYVQRSIDQFPRQGHRGPWRVRQNYLLDSALTLRRDLSRTLRFGTAPVVEVRAPASLETSGT
ncbi:MAG TPA: NAD(P)/FAD-dependent oxidoreductase [Marmoricola sp.]|nr:NAD(P)/FAD-dependent oxidoreductase [Marmoricola sp.]